MRHTIIDIPICHTIEVPLRWGSPACTGGPCPRAHCQCDRAHRLYPAPIPQLKRLAEAAALLEKQQQQLNGGPTANGHAANGAAAKQNGNGYATHNGTNGKTSNGHNNVELTQRKVVK